VGVSNTETITGLKTFQGTSATDGGQLGSELLTTGTGTGWTGTNFTSGYTHSSGTTALISTFAPTALSYYQVVYTISGATLGTVSIVMGSVTLASGQGNGTGTYGIKATSTNNLSVTPTTDFNGTIVISVKLITAGTATISMNNSSGTLTNEIRSFTSNTNTAIGLQAGQRITTGTLNTFFGYQAGANTTSNIGNVGIGYQALLSNTTGQLNTAIGQSALSNNTYGNSNMAIGYSCLSSNTTGSDNIGIGYACLSNLTSGLNNNAFGTNAGRRISGGVTNLTSSDNSIFIGYSAYPLANSQTNQIVIGYQAVGLGSNTTVIGNSSTTSAKIWGSLATTGRVMALTSKTAAYNVTATDEVIIADATSSAFNVTLPTAVGVTGQTYTIKRINSGANIVTIATTSSQTIDGSTTAPIKLQYQSLTVVSDGANWHII
jgi:hypothetical protein